MVRGSIVDYGAMDFTCRDEDNISGKKLVSFSFYIVAHTAVLKIEKLVEIMVMALEIPCFCVCQIKNLKIIR